MAVVKWTLIGLVLLPVAESAAFLLVAVTIGWFWALVLFLATSVIGILLLRQAGRANLQRLWQAVQRDGLRALHPESPGFAPVAGGILLVFPGFITDVIGALMFMPPLRRWIGATIGRAIRKRRPAQQPGVIDLGPDEWHQVSDGTRKKRPRTRRASAGTKPAAGG
jgi:UPF0716 family protein affecting phage T7 exclusion